MNLNDARAAAYKNTAKSDSKSDGEKKLFAGVNKKIGDIFSRDRKSGGSNGARHSDLARSEREESRREMFRSAQHDGNDGARHSDLARSEREESRREMFRSAQHDGNATNIAGVAGSNIAGAGDNEKSVAQKAREDDALLKVREEKEGGVYTRVAKFLLLIGVDEAAKVMQHLSEEQIEKIVPELARVRSVSPDEATEILSEFQGLIKQARAQGGVDTAREMLEKAYGKDRAEEILQNAAPESEGKPFEYLNDADDERVWILLKDESPAVQALVLSRINPAKAAAVIKRMDDSTRREVVARLAKMQSVSPDMLRRIDKAMHEKSLSLNIEKAESIDGRASLAAILRRMSPATGDEILNNIISDDPDLGNELKNQLFTIDDVEKSDDRFMQEELRSMSEKDIAFLIADKRDSFREKILSNLSKGRRSEVLEEETLNKPMRKRDCDDVTNHFLNSLRTAYEEGRFKIEGRDDEYVD